MDTITKKENRLPREVWIAGISLKGIWPVDTVEQRMKDVLQRLESVYPFEPDIICLPETVNISWVNEVKGIEDIAEDEDSHGPITSMLADVARKQNCYVACPIITILLIKNGAEIPETFCPVRPFVKRLRIQVHGAIQPARHARRGGIRG